MAAADGVAEGLSSDAWVIDNSVWSNRSARLSVLIPFYRYDPTPLLTALARQAGAQSRIEFLLLDDGGGDGSLVRRVEEHISGLEVPSRLMVLGRNEGRARGRNRLVAAARTPHLLLLDCDMRPGSDDFLQQHVACAERDAPVVVGGFAVEADLKRSEDRLHAALQRRGECLPAARRALHPEKYVFTSNLLVRRDVLKAEPFDPSFTGWGWEDVEWGMRVARRFPILHIDNPAFHLGLDAPEDLAGKYEQSVANFARLVALHPDVVAAYPSYRAAKAFKRIPLRSVWRNALKRLALAAHAPMIARVYAMKAYRSALYADALK